MGIMSVGVDIENISRFENMAQKLLERVFTKAELEFCFKSSSPAKHLAARFCAKEATFKALPFDEIALKNIEVSSSPNGRPSLIVHDDRAKGLDIKVSLSHTDETAVAFIVISENNDYAKNK